jgi:hypothetical protein
VSDTGTDILFVETWLCEWRKPGVFCGSVGLNQLLQCREGSGINLTRILQQKRAFKNDTNYSLRLDVHVVEKVLMTRSG